MGFLQGWFRFSPILTWNYVALAPSVNVFLVITLGYQLNNLDTQCIAIGCCMYNAYLLIDLIVKSRL
jgi:hypothetical protein